MTAGENAELELAIEEPEAPAPNGNFDSLFDDGVEDGDDTPPSAPTNDLYVYRAGEPKKVIDDGDGGVNILVLKEIYDSELSVKKRADGFHVVYYEGEPIVEMRGIGYLQTENGCAPIENWML
ncbi:MAG TPA: hypothetical protein DCQ32_07890 [Cyanobacteria bacterium UBA8156]|jgi:hypothetical protein|nr:hypothetical protein [Cyanobacteria bacterium UBA8156]